MKVWQKDYLLDEAVERFTVGDDYHLDQQLVKYECLATMAHARMLEKIGIITREELYRILPVLQEIVSLWEAGEFSVRPEDEDCHSAVENYLSQRLGDLGAKIHTARSRNDQVITILRMFYRDQLTLCQEELERLQAALRDLQTRFGTLRFPGFTHTRKAMPTDVYTWTGAFLAAFKDDQELIKFVKRMINRSPLGSGAGFGVPLSIDRQFTAKELDFLEVQQNPLYCQNSRSKYEALLLHALTQIMLDVNRLASDLIFFSLDELGYFELPVEFCTGSSIMPQKKNPDVLELLRARSQRVLALEVLVTQIGTGLISGYHRDLQETKGPVMESLQLTLSGLKILTKVIENLKVNEDRCGAGLTPEVFATDEVYKLVAEGVPFRKAYQQVAKKLFSKNPDSPGTK